MVLGSACAIAFKEWAAVCAALAAGRQTLILRKGGIAEGPAGFRPKHDWFWLLPTRFHERPEKLQPGDASFFDQAQADAPPADRIRLREFAVVAEMIELKDVEQLPALEPLHVYGAATIRERFHYRRPGLFLLAVRVYRAPQPIELSTWPELAGCHTWVDLPAALSTAGLQPVLAEEEFSRRLAEIRQAML